MTDWIWTAIWTLLPISELRGGLPFALAKGLPWIMAYPFCVAINAAVAPLAYLFLDTVHKILYRWAFYSRIFDKLVERSRHKIAEKIKRWGFWGITIFVAIPLPITGAWTGIFGAWILGLNRKKAMLAILIGVAISGLIVSGIVLLGFEAFEFMVKHVENS